MIAHYAGKIQELKAEIGKVVIGQEEMINTMIYTFLSKGHILLEGVPGLAKSLAVETFAKVIGGSFKRFQFTPDKMPGDITGTTIYHEQTSAFVYYRGPIFCNIFLADEINRASPKVQSALLQAMQEKEVTAEGETYPIPDPFIVLATQNPIEQIGTYPLAESQVDRFMVKYDVGYPNPAEERELIRRKHFDFEARKADVRQILTIAEVLAMQALIHDHIRVTGKIMDYLLKLCVATRPPATYRPLDGQGAAAGEQREIHQYIKLGASPRASESLLALAKTLAFCQGRDFVNFDDVNTCAAHVLRHRMLLNSHASARQINADMLVHELLKKIRPY